MSTAREYNILIFAPSGTHVNTLVVTSSRIPRVTYSRDGAEVWTWSRTNPGTAVEGEQTHTRTFPVGWYLEIRDAATLQTL
jgi:hypothetical protein